MIYRRRWFRNARPVTFIVLPRAYVRIRIAFFPTFSEIEKEYAAGERRLTGAEGRGAKSETIAILGETFRSGVLTVAVATSEIRIYPQREARSTCICRAASRRHRNGQRKHERPPLREKGVDVKRGHTRGKRNRSPLCNTI